MGELVVDAATDRSFYLDQPDDLKPGEKVTFILSLHGGGSSGQWQHGYFPAQDVKDKYRLVIATPTAASDEPKRWVAEADDEHLQNVVNIVVDRFGAENIAAFWLAGHSQGGMTSNRLLRTPFFADRVDGWLSLSGGRLGPAERAANAGPPRPAGAQAGPPPGFTRPPTTLPEADFSFIYATGEHEIASLPEDSPWADKYEAGARKRMEDVIDDQPGKVYDGRRDGNSTKAWGFKPAPGTAQVYVFPDAKDGRVIADVVRIDKGHTEGLEPNITDAIVKLMVSASGGKLQRLT
jgi:hypothetical protein